MPNIDQALQTLAALAIEQRLRDRAMACCRKALQTCQADERRLALQELGGWSVDELEARFERSSLVFEHADVGHPYVETQIGLFAGGDPAMPGQGVSRVGSYRLICLLDGELDDDYLVIDVEKPGPTG